MKLAWDLGPFAAVPPCLHLDTPLLEQQNTEKLSGTKNISVHAQLGQILDERYKRDQKPTNATLEKPGAKTGYHACLLHTALPEGVGKQPKPPLPSPHKGTSAPRFGEQAKEPVACSPFPCCCRDPDK